MQINKLLVPVDFSRCSDAAVDYAAFVGGIVHASIDVMHVWSPPGELASVMLGSPLTDPADRHRELAEVVKTQAGERLKQMLLRLTQAGVEDARARLEQGVPHRAILKVAHGGDYDLIVMGTRGRAGLSHALVGSVAERVLRSSRLPVLTVREPEQQARLTAGTVASDGQTQVEPSP